MVGIKLKPTPIQIGKENSSRDTQSVAELFRARKALHRVGTLSTCDSLQQPTPATKIITVPHIEESFIGDIIDLDDLPKEMFQEPDEVSFFWIGEKDGENENNILAVGKRLILTAQHQTPDIVNKKAMITWCSRRDDIRSLTLDVEATVADLALIDGSSKSLVFDSADDCLCFAQDFYRHKTSSSKRP
eukprot:595915-Ditylum_brightwellii.AAC.1